MPCFRGIDLSVVATSDNSEFPEFPHPDGSSARFGGPHGNRHSGSMFLSPRPPKQGARLSAETQRYADPKISVYIPSAAETNFFFRYNVTQPPVGHRFLCFRVIINGRDIVSWGIDLDESTSGATHQALFQPSIKYQRYINGVLMTQYGIESRCFRFVSYGAPKASVADDGGLIEVQVFRAKARSRRAPQPDHYRGRERYGISLVSNGLLENPQAASYYDYHLVDANDSPYASFRFHYRSWENLVSLQLAHDEKPQFLTGSPDRPAFKKMSDKPSFDFDHEQVDGDYELSNSGSPLHDEYADSWEKVPRLYAQARSERPLPQLPDFGKSMVNLGTFSDDAVDENGVDDVEQAQEFRIQRTRSLSAVSTLSKSSATTNVSVAKSLQAYADGESGLLVDTMEYGSAIELGTVFYGKPSKRSVSGYKLAHMPPFTDDLCKRPCSPNKPRLRGVSSDSSPKSRGSPVKRRLHGGSLDSSIQLVL